MRAEDGLADATDAIEKIMARRNASFCAVRSASSSSRLDADERGVKEYYEEAVRCTRHNARHQDST